MKEKFKEHKKMYISVLIIVVLAICAVVGYTAKVKYDQKQEKIRAERIETKNKEISKTYKSFEKEEDRTKKLEILKSFEKEYSQYKKSGSIDEICEKEYANKIKSMKNFFVKDYDDTISTISDEIGKDIESFNDKDKLSAYIKTLTDLKAEIKSESKDYNIVDKDKLEEYNNTIDKNIKSYNDRLEVIKKKEKEDAEKKKAEEEAKAKKAAEEAAKAQQQANTGLDSNNSSSDNSGYVDNESSSYNSGNYSNDYSGENYNYSGGSSDNSYSGGNSGSGSYGSNNSNGNYNYTYGSITSDGGTWNFTKDNNTGDYWDADTGEYGGNIHDWM